MSTDGGGELSPRERFDRIVTKTQEGFENLHDFLATPHKTRLQLLMAVPSFFHDEDVAAQATEDIMTHDPEEVEAEIEALAASQLVKRISSMDPLSKIAAATYSEEKRTDPWWLYNESAWIRGLEGVHTRKGPMFGQFGAIDGQGTGRGKTGFGVKLGEVALSKGYGFITNVQLGDVPADVESRVLTVARMSGLIRAAIAMKREAIKTLWVLDEVPFFFGRQDAMSKESKTFHNFARWTRKLGGSLVVTVHDYDTDIPERFKGFVKSRFTKSKLKDVRVLIEADHIKIRRNVSEVPDAKLPYETESRGAFTLDVDILALSDYLTQQLEANPEADEDTLTLRYLDNPYAALEDPFAKKPPPTESALEKRVREVIAEKPLFVDEAGAFDPKRIMSHFGIVRQSAKEVADTAAQRTGALVTEYKKRPK